MRFSYKAGAQVETTVDVDRIMKGVLQVPDGFRRYGGHDGY